MVQRKFILGEEWMYYKLYCGARTADMLLADVIYPLTQNLKKRQLVSEWFFIRYTDPDPHLRIRFLLSNEQALSKVITQVKEALKPYLEEQLLWSLQTDTYVRELERYGSKTMEVSETLFYHHSELVVKALTTIEDEELYFLFILKTITKFISQFDLTTEVKLNFYQNNAKAFKEEFGVQKMTKLGLDKKYRAIRDKLQYFLENTHPDYDTLWELLNEHIKAIQPAIRSILTLSKKQQLEMSLESLLGSYVHMLVNRAFRSRQRFYELVAYDFLERNAKTMFYKLKSIRK